MFKGGNVDVKAQVGHNTHENVSKVQEGGTVLLLYGTLVDQYDWEASSNSKDPTGLGRWVKGVMESPPELYVGITPATPKMVCVQRTNSITGSSLLRKRTKLASEGSLHKI